MNDNINIEEVLALAPDTKACRIGHGIIGEVGDLFRSQFPQSGSVIVIDDSNTRKVAGLRVIDVMRKSGLNVAEHTINPDGAYFHATYDKVEEVRKAIGANPSAVPIAVGSGTINDLVKRASEEVGVRYMVVGTAASMDGYTSYGASITKDGMKQTLPCRAPLAALVDTGILASAPREMTASGYADLIAKIPAGADWLLSDAIVRAVPEMEKHGCERIHELAWKCVQGPLRDSLANPDGAASGDEGEIGKLSRGLLMSAFAMQAAGTSRPASGTEHQVSHYWDMEDLSFGGRPVSHGFKVGIGTLISTATIEFLLERDLSGFDIGAAVDCWPRSFEDMARTFPAVYGNRPDHIRRAESEMSKKYVTPDVLGKVLEFVCSNWASVSRMLKAQIMPFAEVKSKLKAVGAPSEPEMIGVSRERFLETYFGVAYMRARYFTLDLVMQLGLQDELMSHLFGVGGIWEVKETEI